MLPIIALSALLLAPPPGPDVVRTEWIPAGASVVAHLDFQALTKGRVGRILLDHMGDVDVNSLSSVCAWPDELGLEPGVDVRGLTIYGVGEAGDFEPVLIVALSDAADRLFEEMPEESDHRVRTVDGHEVHSFVAEDERLYAHVTASRDGARPVLFCKELAALLDALAVLEGEAPSLAGSGRPMASLGRRPGTFLAFETTDVGALAEEGPTSQLFRESAAFRIEAGEHEGEFFADVLIAGKGEDSVANIADIAEGILAIARLVARNEDAPEDVKAGRLLLLESIRFQSEGRSFKASFRCDAEKLAALLEENEQRLKERKE